MSWWQPDQFEKKVPYLQTRMALLKRVRNFFDEQDFWEVQMPALQTSPTMDTHIHAFKTEALNHALEHERDYYLHTSPEFAMKKLLVAGAEKIYQLGPVFRNAEASALHSKEFTMLEWYRAHSGYDAVIDDTLRLILFLGVDTFSYNGQVSDPSGDWLVLTCEEAFKEYADIELASYLQDIDGFRGCVEEAGIRTAPEDRWDDLFFRVMAAKIEPHLGVGVPSILKDYPASMAALAQKKPDDPRFAERFELYICGVELANGFGELTDAVEQRARYEREMQAKKEIYGFEYPVDQEFLAALEYGMPPSGGVALGFDRLVMLACGQDDISNVLWQCVI